MNTVEQVRAIVRDVSGLDKGLDDPLYGPGGLADIQALSLLLAIESRFGVDVPDEEFVRATTPRLLGGLVYGLVGGLER